MKTLLPFPRSSQITSSKFCVQPEISAILPVSTFATCCTCLVIIVQKIIKIFTKLLYIVDAFPVWNMSQTDFHLPLMDRVNFYRTKERALFNKRDFKPWLLCLTFDLILVNLLFNFRVFVLCRNWSWIYEETVREHVKEAFISEFNRNEDIREWEKDTCDIKFDTKS